MEQKIFESKCVVRMHDTDATGVIYFNQVFRFACNLFEEALDAKGFDLKGAIENNDLVFPIVACSSEYFKPLRLSEKLTISLFLQNLGEKSFSLLSKFFIEKEGSLASQVLITHACVSKTTQKACVIPDYLKVLFK